MRIEKNVILQVAHDIFLKKGYKKTNISEIATKAKIAAGTAKMGVLAGTTFLNSTLGLAVGIGTAIGEERWSGLWDNEVSNALDEINKASEKLLPNYYSTEEMETPWTNNIFTANFLGDKVLKNMGFTIGAIAAGSLTGGGINSLLGSAARSTGGKILTRTLAGAVSAAGESWLSGRRARRG